MNPRGRSSQPANPSTRASAGASSRCQYGARRLRTRAPSLTESLSWLGSGSHAERLPPTSAGSGGAGGTTESATTGAASKAGDAPSAPPDSAVASAIARGGVRVQRQTEARSLVCCTSVARMPVVAH